MKKTLIVPAILSATLAVTTSSASAARQSTATTLAAVVTVDGMLARGRGAVSSAQLGVDGQYEVVFDQDVSNCTYVASGGESTILGPDDAVVFTVAPRLGNANAILIQEWDGVLGRDSYSSGFHVVVVC
jgi:hypothetical protein